MRGPQNRGGEPHPGDPVVLDEGTGHHKSIMARCKFRGQGSPVWKHHAPAKNPGQRVNDGGTCRRAQRRLVRWIVVGTMMVGLRCGGLL